MSILDGFDVVAVPRTFSISEIRILKNRISFNLSTASEIGYPTFVRMFISKDKTQIALQPCEKTTPNAMKFFTAEYGSKRRKRTIGVGNKALAALIKSGMGWDMSVPICAPGIRFADENVVIFDLKQAYMKDTKPQTGLCLVPRPAVPFAPVPTKYFCDSAPLFDDGIPTLLSGG